MTYKNESIIINEKIITPKRLMLATRIKNSANLLSEKELCVSFGNCKNTVFEGKGASIILDFGIEICGGIRIITRDSGGKTARLKLRFGESLCEATSSYGLKNATNDHAPRDLDVIVSTLSDLSFGLTGFRFVYIELLDENPLSIQNIFAVCKTQHFEHEAKIKTNDSALNKILDTAMYTLKLNFQNGYIWDGIKRDRLVWSGDLHQEIITSLYLFGDTVNIRNSLDFLRKESANSEWINGIPTYSAWWVINLCDYCCLSGNKAYYRQNKDFAQSILKKIDASISENGEMNFGKCAGMPFFLDWPTYETEDAVTGTAALMSFAANRFIQCESDYAECKSIIKKLSVYFEKPNDKKQIRAFQILGGKKPDNDSELFENGGASGFSTFMAYYILKADAITGGTKMLDIIKQYFGGMLSRGATTFWEDFDIQWLKDSGRIDEFPKDGQKDIHGDYGNYCYRGFRHSLCHGWSSGIVSFFIENVLGLKVKNGFREITVSPNLYGLKWVKGNFPTPFGNVEISLKTDSDGSVISEVKVPDRVRIIKDSEEQ